jgi:alanine dehydrogenase
VARETIILTRDEIAEHIQQDKVIDVIERCMLETEKGHDVMPPKLIMEVGGGIAACLAGYVEHLHALTMKCGQERKENANRGLPTIHVTVNLYDPDTGELLAIMEGLLPTVMRTGAAAAVAIKALARQDAKILTVIGAGNLGRQAAEAASAVIPFEKIYVWDQRDEAIESFMDAVARRTPTPVESAEPREAVSAADVILTCTNSFEPIVRSEWVRPGAHLSCMGADLAEKQEVETHLLSRCRLFADSIEQCVTRGEVSKAVASGLLTEDCFEGTIGELLAGKIAGRSDDEEITLYDGTGLGVQDTAMAKYVYDVAVSEGLGRRIEF